MLAKLALFRVYAVNDDAPLNRKDEFFKLLHREISSIEDSKNIIILDDLIRKTGTKLGDKIAS